MARPQRKHRIQRQSAGKRVTVAVPTLERKVDNVWSNSSSSRWENLARGQGHTELMADLELE